MDSIKQVFAHATAVDYRILVREETVEPLAFTLRELRDFDEAVDMMFTALDRVGDGEQLVRLCPFFGKLWPSARALALEVVRIGANGGLIGKRLLELGCGLALPSMVAARLGAEVTSTDFHPDVAGFLLKNLSLNDIQGVDFSTVDWTSPGACEALANPFDWVIGSDVLYDPTHADAVAALMRRCVKPTGTVLLTDPGRAYLQEFVTRMDSHGFTPELRAVSVQGDGDTRKDIYVMEFSGAGTHGSLLRMGAT